MRSITALVVALLAVALPAPALAGTFTVPFGYGTPMTGAGWVAKPAGGRHLRLRGRRDAVAERRDAARAHRVLLPLQRPGPRPRSSPSTSTHGFAKASAATALCTYSFAARAGRHAAPLRRRLVQRRDRHERRQLGRARALQRGRLADRASRPRAPTTRSYAGGWVTLSDPTPPEVWANGPTGVQSGLTALLEWAASDSESGSPAVVLLDRRRRARGAARAGVLVDLRHARQRQRRPRPRRRSPTGRTR